jgi:7-cyano-7-deazaguanine synthase
MHQKLKRNSILLASGGMDSTTLAYWLVYREIPFEPLFVNYGQHCATTELETLRKVLPKAHLRKLSVVNVSSVYAGSTSRLIRETDLWREGISHDDLYLPYRNILLLSIAAARVQSVGGGTVYTAFINSNHASEIDCSAGFFAKLEKLMKSYGGVRVKMPFRYKSKLQVAKIGIRLKAPIGETFSCQVNSDIPCGVCPNCVDRLDALRALER